MANIPLFVHKRSVILLLLLLTRDHPENCNKPPKHALAPIVLLYWKLKLFDEPKRVHGHDPHNR